MKEKEPIKKYIKTLTIVAAVLVVIGALIMTVTYFVFYSEDIPSGLEKNHTVLVDGKVIGLDISSS